MSTEKYVAGAQADLTVLSTQLNALADAAYSDGGVVLGNDVSLDRFAVAELDVTYGTAPNDESVCDLYMLPARDGTNYPDGSSTVRPSALTWCGSFMLRNVNTAQKVTCPMFELLPFKTKFILRNRGGQAFPASGSLVKITTFNRASA